MAATWIDLELVILSEVSLTEKYHISPIGVLLQKNVTNEMYSPNRNGVTEIENKLMAMGMRGRRNKLENWD